MLAFGKMSLRRAQQSESQLDCKARQTFLTAYAFIDFEDRRDAEVGCDSSLKDVVLDISQSCRECSLYDKAFSKQNFKLRDERPKFPFRDSFRFARTHESSFM